MPWVKLTDDWYDDDAMASVGPLGLAMWVTGLSWCARNLTDGRIPHRQARKLIDLQGIAVDGEPLLADQVASQLVEAGVWSRMADGYLVRNYLKYQPSREKVLGDRAKDRERKSSRPRAAGQSSPPPPDAPPLEDDDLSGRTRADFQTESAGNRQPPVPGPVGSVVNTSSSDSRGEPDEPDDGSEAAGEVPDEVWDLFAEMRLKQQTKEIKNPAGWKKSTIKNARKELGFNARRWWSTYNIPPRHLAECLVDGRPPKHAPLRRRAVG